MDHINVMSTPIANPVIRVTEKDIQEVRERYNTSEQKIKEDIRILRNWLKKNPHLPQDINDRRLESFLLFNKFSLEKTKTKLENYATIRGHTPEFFDYSFPSNINIQNIRKCLYWCPLSKMTERKERVSIFKLFDQDLDKYDPLAEISYIFMLVELQYLYDYNFGNVLIFDLENFSLGHFLKVTPVIAQKTNHINKEVYSSRLKSIHVVNQPAYVDMIFALLKTILDTKIYNRIKLHKNYESLHQDVPKEILPTDLGGDGTSLADLHEIIGDVLANLEDHYVNLLGHVTNEKLRINKGVENDILGFQGSFRKLTID